MADGSNVDDLGDYRPGLRALQELHVRSPLREAGLTKEDIRILSRRYGLPTWNKPAFACLASRIPYGEEITPQKLRQVEEDGDHHRHDHEHHHHHEHRGLAEIQAMIEDSSLSQRVKEMSVAIFQNVAKAEAKIHGKPVEQVHFHEVGAVDSIVDIVAAAVCLDSLQIEEVIVPMLSEGQGTVCCQHGILPIPVPAVTQDRKSVV